MGAHCLRDELVAEHFSRGRGLEADTPQPNVGFQGFNVTVGEVHVRVCKAPSLSFSHPVPPWGEKGLFVSILAAAFK